jgi:endonuclease/exonuclease/phosphatase family metal-dependent hydrolase
MLQLVVTLCLVQITSSKSFYPSQRHLFKVSPAKSPPKFTGDVENTGYARRVKYYATRLEDVFEEESQSESQVAYGGVMGKGGITDPPVDRAECVGAAEAAMRLLQLNLFDLMDIVFCRRHLLRVTNDHGKSQMILPVQMLPNGGSLPHYTDAHVVEGINYFLRLDVRGAVHEVTLNFDREGYYNMYQHTVIVKGGSTAATHMDNDVEFEVNAQGEPIAAAVMAETPPLKILTLNVWNTNPPSWSAGAQREEKYRKRIHLLATLINNTKADIIGLQEVRYDSSMGKPGDHFQMRHLLDALGAPGQWHYMYNPSMNYFDAQRYARNGREEEGAAVLSRHPIVDTDFVLLPRFWDDGEDNQHQRQCIRARVKVPNGWGMIDVFTTHLSLSERARDASVQEMWKYVKSVENGSTFQVLLGDFNAEPDTHAIQYLQGFKEGTDGTRTDFQDAWLAAGHPEPESHSQDLQVQRNMLTFPSDEPKKRIDLILFREVLRKDGKGKGGGQEKNVHVTETRLVGQDPSEETKDDPGHGMLDGDSPMWASDHRGVVTTFVSKR